MSALLRVELPVTAIGSLAITGVGLMLIGLGILTWVLTGHRRAHSSAPANLVAGRVRQRSDHPPAEAGVARPPGAAGDAFGGVTGHQRPRHPLVPGRRPGRVPVEPHQ